GKRLTVPGKAAKAAPAAPQLAAALPQPVPAPASASYTVKAGDTLHAIARANGLDPKQVMAANGGKTTLRVGDKINLPGKAAPAPAQVAAAPQAPAPKGTPQPAAAKTFGQPAPAPAASKAFAQAAPQPAAAKQQAAEKQTKPAGKSVNYKVGPGDTLWGIAKKFNVDPSSLMAWNNIKSGGALQAGSQLTIHSQ
nr:LysM peptidoglycan-binding domain-containing protein [Solidesulfovibrio magneticus]